VRHDKGEIREEGKKLSQGEILGDRGCTRECAREREKKISEGGNRLVRKRKKNDSERLEGGEETCEREEGGEDERERGKRMTRKDPRGEETVSREKESERTSEMERIG